MVDATDLPQLAAGYGYVVVPPQTFVVDQTGAFVTAQGPLVNWTTSDAASSFYKETGVAYATVV